MPTAFVQQSYPPGHNSFGPNRITGNPTTATLTTTGATVIPAGAYVDVTAWLSYDNQATWTGPVWSTRLLGGQAAGGVSGSSDISGASHYRIDLDVVGGNVTIGVSITVT